MATCAHVYINEPVARLSVSIHFTPLKKKQKNKSRSRVIDLGLLHAKKLLALFWKKTKQKQTCIPSLVHWVRQMLITFPLERVAYVRKGRQDLFKKGWGPFDAFVKSRNLTDDSDEVE